MKEFRSICEAWSAVDTSVRKTALATVVRVHGSSYRSPGARMLITDDGKWVGSISGGCLEGDALRKSRQVMLSGQAITITYDTREESNQHLGIGLGCNGVIDVLIEPVDTADNPVELFQTILDSREPLVMCTVISGGSFLAKKWVWNAQGTLLNGEENPLTGMLVADFHLLAQAFKSEIRAYTVENQQVEVFWEWVQPGIRLAIFGGGFDARPVSKLAKSMGWEVLVTDECVAHIAPLFFPDADTLSLCHRELVQQEMDISPYTACVLMSHNYEYDRDVLGKLLTTPTPYIGVLGPRKRFDKMVGDLEAQGIALTGDDLHRIHSPIGLDIGAETPDEIALAIVAEVQARFTGRSGGFLRYRTGPIHLRTAGSEEVHKHLFLPSEGWRQSSGA
jgi:xanthine dehydrogenase accessory factor